MRRGICVNTPQVAEDQTASVMSSFTLNRFLTAEYITKYQNIDAEQSARKGAKKLKWFSLVLNAKYIQRADLPSSSLFLSCEINYLLLERCIRWEVQHCSRSKQSSDLVQRRSGQTARPRSFFQGLTYLYLNTRWCLTVSHLPVWLCDVVCFLFASQDFLKWCPAHVRDNTIGMCD